ncbi:Fibroblast growth factor receptor, partial [Geodia barretti]
MIDGDGIIKVADFGLAVEEVNSKGYFRQDKSDCVRLPFKWMALESLQEGVFTTKTDVWSFGVTMWEVFCGGRGPYPGVEAHTLPNLLQHGHRLEMPNNAACSEQ